MVAALATMLGVAAAAVYARLTYRLLKLSMQTAAREIQPLLQLEFPSSPAGSIVVTNVGRAWAFSVMLFDWHGHFICRIPNAGPGQVIASSFPESQTLDSTGMYRLFSQDMVGRWHSTELWMYPSGANNFWFVSDVKTRSVPKRAVENAQIR